MIKTYSHDSIKAIIVSGLLILSSCSAITKNELTEFEPVRERGVHSIDDSKIRAKAIVHRDLSEGDKKGAGLNFLAKNPSLNQYILHALKESSELKGAFEAYRAALQKSSQVTSLPDPTLSYGYFVNEIETRIGPQDQRVGIMQPIPWFGKLSLKGDIADSEASAAFYAFLTKKNDLIVSITEAFYEISYLKSAQDITEANLELLKRWEQILLQKYRSQTSTQADLIKAQVELGTIEDKLRELKALELPLTARLNSLLNRETDEKVYVQVDKKRGPLDSVISKLKSTNQKELEELLHNNNPEILHYEALIEAKDSGIDLANKDFYPDLGLGLDYVFVGNREQAVNESGNDALVAMFSVKLPLYRSKYEAGLKQAKSEKQSVTQLKEAKKYALRSKMAKTVFDIRDSERKVGLYSRTLVPKAEESLQSTYTAFESGESSFLNLLDAERIYLQFKLARVRAETDLNIATARLLALLGDFSFYDSRNNQVHGEKQ